MSVPRGLAYDTTNSRLFVVDDNDASTNNNRVLIYNVATITNGQNAINVLGQPNFTTANPANTQSGMNMPSGLTYDTTNQRLFVSEEGGNRVKIFDVAPPATLSTAVINGSTLILSYNEALDTSSVPATSAFTLHINGLVKPVS